MKTRQRPVVESYARSWQKDALIFLHDKRNRSNPSVAEALAFLDKPGVYVLYQGETVYYIGRASNLGKRLRTHTRIGSRYSEHWSHISIFAIPDETQVKAVESILIAAVPAGNGARPKIKRIALPAAFRMAKAKGHGIEDLLPRLRHEKSKISLFYSAVNRNSHGERFALDSIHRQPEIIESVRNIGTSRHPV